MLFVLQGIAWAVVIFALVFLIWVGVHVTAVVLGEKALVIPLIAVCLVAGFILASSLRSE